MPAQKWWPDSTGYLTAGSNEWQAPYNGFVLVELVGAGGGAAGGAGSGGRGGAGGGAYVLAIVPVLAGSWYRLTRGAGGSGAAWNSTASTPGGDSGFYRLSGAGGSVAETLALAKGGLNSTGTGGALGGAAADCIGDTKTSGGSGSARNVGQGGNGGAGGGPFGGAGGLGGNVAGNTDQIADNGTAPGGGGGGGRVNSTGGQGGNGAPGFGRISYYLTFGAVKVAGELKDIVEVGVKVGGVYKKIRPVIKVGGVEKQLARMTGAAPSYAAGVPSYVPAGSESLYDTETGMFNINAGNSAKLKATMQLANSSLREWMVVGDSAAEGWTSLIGLSMTEDRNHAFPLMARDHIASTLGLTIAGDGHVRTQSAALVARTADKRWTPQNKMTQGLGGTTSSGHYISWANPSVDITLTPLNPGRYVEVAGLDLADIDVTVNGVTTVLDGTGTGLPKIWTIDTGSEGMKTITVSPSASATISISSATIRKSVGLMVNNMAQGGSKAYKGDNQTDWSDTSLGYGNMGPFYSHANMFGDVDFVMIELGGNDMQQNPVDFVAFRAGMQYIGDRWPSADIMLVNLVEGNGFEGDYNQMWPMMFDLALDNDWMLFDGKFVLNDFATMQANGWTGDDFGHLSTLGATVFGEALGQAMMVGTGLI